MLQYPYVNEIILTFYMQRLTEVHVYNVINCRSAIYLQIPRENHEILDASRVTFVPRKNERIHFESLDEMFDRVAKRGRESERTFRSRASRGLHTRFDGNPVTGRGHDI